MQKRGFTEIFLINNAKDLKTSYMKCRHFTVSAGETEWVIVKTRKHSVPRVQKTISVSVCARSQVCVRRRSTRMGFQT